MNKSKKFISLIITLLLVVALVSCNTNNQITYETKENLEKDDQVDLAVTSEAKDISFTQAELEYIDQLKESGFITIATRPNKLTYHIEEDGSISGFHYEIIKSFADDCDLDIKVVECGFNDYFKIDGNIPDDVETNPDQVYTPDLFLEVDLFLANLTILPWREKLMRFVKIIPSRELIVTRKGETISDLNQLVDKQIAVALNTSHHVTLMRLQEEVGAEFNFYLTDEYYDLVKIVAEGDADLTVFDSDRLFYEMETYGNLDVSMAVSDLQDLSWAVQKENEILASILQKHIIKIKESGFYNELWQKYYYIDVNDYLKIINYSEEN